MFEQWIDPANLAVLDERDRTIVLVLAFTGFRVSSVVTLTRDCVEVGSDGHPYLRYFNVKGSREAMLPIPPLLAEQLGRQQAFLEESFPDTEWLFPSRLRRGAKRGVVHINPSTVSLVIERYVRRAEIRTADGKLALAVMAPQRADSAATSRPQSPLLLTFGPSGALGEPPVCDGMVLALDLNIDVANAHACDRDSAHRPIERTAEKLKIGPPIVHAPPPDPDAAILGEYEHLFMIWPARHGSDIVEGWPRRLVDHGSTVTRPRGRRLVYGGRVIGLRGIACGEGAPGFGG
ncbi:MAG: tyrosine-type recombinase/integrase, partial [Solirubrobacteraceae bacterium]